MYMEPMTQEEYEMLEEIKAGDDKFRAKIAKIALRKNIDENKHMYLFYAEVCRLLKPYMDDILHKQADRLNKNLKNLLVSRLVRK